MHRTVLALSALVLLAVCSQAHALCLMDRELAWKRARLDLKKAKDSETAARILETLRSRCGVPLNLWAGPATDEDETVAHPCSGVMVKFIKTVPSPDDPRSRPEKIYEYNPAGEVVAVWWAPIEATVMAIEGDQLLLSVWVDIGPEETPPVLMTLGPKGSLRVVPYRETPEVQGSRQCPASLPDAEHLTCYEFKDQKSGASRWIAYEGRCT